MPELAHKTRIAILGGGIGSLTAAFELTNVPNWKDRYEITVYQMGWRLGGKGASGRNADKHQRIEEHGLHIWLGMYENAFHLMQACYGELNRPPTSPLATWDEAFKKQNYIRMMEDINGQWIPWSMTIPPNDGVPGHGGIALNPINFVRRLIQWMHSRFQRPAQLKADQVPEMHLRAAREKIEALDDHAESHPPAEHQTIIQHLEQVRTTIRPVARASVVSDFMRREMILIELGITLVKGILVDRTFTSFDPLDQEDFRAWFRRHGASDEVIESSPVRSIYEIVFSYEKGQKELPKLAAGVAVRFVLRCLFTYQGAFIYKMQAGMGDVVFTPLFQVLQQRGVQFQFFHRVLNLGLAPDQKSVATIDMARQVKLAVPQYNPLVTVEQLLCWPSEPLYDQIDPAQAAQLKQLRQQGIEPLESSWSPWQDDSKLTLKAGVDFDTVVLGIPLGALKYVAPELVNANSRWKDMVTKVATVQTQSYQVWLNRTAEQMGWDGPERAILDSYRNSWSDMSQVLSREPWPSEDNVHNISYFCKALPEDAPPPDPSSDPAFQLAQAQRVRDFSLKELKSGFVRPILPNAVDPNNPDQLNWDLLVDPTGKAGEERFDYQFWRANIDPTERYVQSLPGPTDSRLRAEESGFSNLVLAGDGVRTGINAGCIEAAVMSGMQASRAICGSPSFVFGEEDFSSRVEGSGCLTSVMAGLGRVFRLFQRSDKQLPATAKPAYIERGGEQVLSQPVVMTGNQAFSFLVDARLDALGALCERYLNRPAAGRVQYQPIVPKVLLTAVQIARVQSQQSPDAQKGWAPEIDMAFWVPVLTRDPGALLPRLVWFQPYLWVDNPWALAAGREIYGFPKELGQFEFPPNLDAPAFFTASTLVLNTYSANSQAVWQKLIDLRRTVPQSWKEVSRSLPDVPSAHKDFTDVLFRDFAERIRREHKLPHETDKLVPLNRIDLVFLKQFRDVADSRYACYQAIVEASVQITQVRSISALDGEYRLQVQPCASHPVIDELGLAAPDLPALKGWHVDFDFVIGNGREMCRVGG